MSSREDKLLTQSKPVEVVANQGEDGSYELRFASHEDGEPRNEQNESPADSGAQRVVAATSTPARGARPLVYIFGGLALTALAVGAFAIVGGDGADEKRRQSPQTVEIDEAPRFRGYVIAPETFEAEGMQVRFEDDAELDEADVGIDAADDEAEDDDRASDEESGESDEVTAEEPTAEEAADELDPVVRQRLSRVRAAGTEEQDEDEFADEELADDEYLDDEYPDEEYLDDEYLDDEYPDEEYLDDE